MAGGCVCLELSTRLNAGACRHVHAQGKSCMSPACVRMQEPDPPPCARTHPARMLLHTTRPWPGVWAPAMPAATPRVLQQGSLPRPLSLAPTTRDAVTKVALLLCCLPPLLMLLRCCLPSPLCCCCLLLCCCSMCGVQGGESVLSLAYVMQALWSTTCCACCRGARRLEKHRDPCLEMHIRAC